MVLNPPNHTGSDTERTLLNVAQIPVDTITLRTYPTKKRHKI